MANVDYHLSGSVNHSGSLMQYSTFRYHRLGNPGMQLSYWNHGAGWAQQYMRFGLRNSAGTQVTNSIQINPGENYVWKQFTALAGQTMVGNLALNARSADYGAYADDKRYTVEWVGTLRLNPSGA